MVQARILNCKFKGGSILKRPKNSEIKNRESLEINNEGVTFKEKKIILPYHLNRFLIFALNPQMQRILVFPNAIIKKKKKKNISVLF